MAVFFIYVHYELPTKAYLFQSVAMVFSKPISMLMLAAGIGAAVWMMAHMPGLLPFLRSFGLRIGAALFVKKCFRKWNNKHWRHKHDNEMAWRAARSAKLFRNQRWFGDERETAAQPRKIPNFQPDFGHVFDYYFACY